MLVVWLKKKVCILLSLGEYFCNAGKVTDAVFCAHILSARSLSLSRAIDTQHIRVGGAWDHHSLLSLTSDNWSLLRKHRAFDRIIEYHKQNGHFHRTPRPVLLVDPIDQSLANIPPPPRALSVIEGFCVTPHSAHSTCSIHTQFCRFLNTMPKELQLVGSHFELGQMH